jgi:hypothetical protein
MCMKERKSEVVIRVKMETTLVHMLLTCAIGSKEYTMIFKYIQIGNTVVPNNNYNN